MRRTLCHSVAPMLLAVTTIASAACASRTVNDILADPSRYRDREVRLSGEVVDSYSFAGKGVYRIEDDTGRLWVMSNRGVPRKGARVSVKGRIQEGFNLGSLGDRVNVPSEVASGLVLVESSHKAEY